MQSDSPWLLSTLILRSEFVGKWFVEPEERNAAGTLVCKFAAQHIVVNGMVILREGRE